MARFYSNENFPLPVVERLRGLGHDVLTSYEAGHANKALADPQVLDTAVQDNRILLTLNRLHFIRLHRIKPSHAGIVVCTFNPDFEAMAAKIHRAVSSAGALHGQLLRVNRE